MKKLLWVLFGIFAYVGGASAASLQFATEATYPPYVYMDASGHMLGFEADLVRALCTQMQKQCVLVNQPWQSLIPSLKLGKFDGLFGGMAVTKEREKQVDFTIPYYQNTASFVADHSQHLMLTKAKLQGKTIGVQGGTTFETYLQAMYGKTITINRYPSIEEALMDLVSGRVDTVVGDTPVIQEWILKNGKGRYAMVGAPITSIQYFGAGIAIAVQKGNQPLQQALNKAIKTIKANGTYCKILRQYLGNTACPV